MIGIRQCTTEPLQIALRAAGRGESASNKTDLHDRSQELHELQEFREENRFDSAEFTLPASGTATWFPVCNS